jgi:hypothetical protein
MSSYTPQQLRDFIDDLDAVLRQAVVRQTLKQVFEAEKKRIVSLLIISYILLLTSSLVDINDCFAYISRHAGNEGCNECTPVSLVVGEGLADSQT